MQLIDGAIKAISVKYSQAMAALQGKLDEKFLVSGVAVLVITSDNQIVIGSRDSTIKVDANGVKHYSLQVANGGVDGGMEDMKYLNIVENNFKKSQPSLNSTQTKTQRLTSINYIEKFGDHEDSQYSLNDFLSQQALREVTEELYNFDKQDVNNHGIEYSMIVNLESMEYLKGGLCVFRTKYTLNELIEMRKNNPPKDIWEMTVIDGVGLNNIVDFLNNKCRINFDGMERTHLQPYVFAGFLQHSNQKLFESFVLSGKLSNSDEMEIEDKDTQKIIQR